MTSDPSLDDTLAEAWRAFDRVRNRDGYEAVALRLRLLCDPAAYADRPGVAGTEFGMQDRDNRRFLTGSIESGTKRAFDVGAVALRDKATGSLRYVGPFVHGPAGDEFLYLNWKRAGEAGWVWRTKSQLNNLTWDAIVAADAAGQRFEFDATGRFPHDNPRGVVWARRNQ